MKLEDGLRARWDVLGIVKPGCELWCERLEVASASVLLLG